MNSLTVLLPALLALVALLFFVGAFLILHLPRLLSSDSLLCTSAGQIAAAAASSHVVAGIGMLAAAAVTAAREMVTDGVSSVVDATAAALSPSLTASISSAWLLAPSHLVSPPLSDSLALLFSSSLSSYNSAPLTSPLVIPSVIHPPCLASPFPPLSVLV
ncbi:unnamed protein product [Closterium sp. NIES-54]